jgi:hypothetical protein
MTLHLRRKKPNLPVECQSISYDPCDDSTILHSEILAKSINYAA